MKPKILVFIDWFLPGYKAGGPIKSISNIISNLHNEFDFSVITSNKDFGDIKEYESIKPNIWIHHETYRIIYLDVNYQNLNNIKRLISEENYYCIYLNSLFSIKYTILPLLALKLVKYSGKVILAPRGMLGEGALKLKSIKKLLFLKIARLIGLYKSVVWHASSSLEALEITSNFGKKTKIAIAKNIASSTYESETTRIKTPNNTSFFFLSRISPKKNLIGALEAIKKVNSSRKFSFDLIGPIEDKSYWDCCLQIIEELPANVTVNYLGHIPNTSINSLLRNYHFLLFPTFSENYGHVVVEAWTAGCPVLLSDQTPWINLESHKVGWNVSPKEENKLVEIIDYCIEMENDEFQFMANQIKFYLINEVLNDDILEQNRKMFTEI